ncbi:gliding motility lipoprotein GldH [Algoriphagus halophytocola]|uniref:Gliding motility lipoprotein GldH n=1 Tax=Algoriphagus halophytocola TaxID=2991499 RepID=A0ABY6MF94_9BACT|nr:gliding motility lipoprotein GldH [Algoriphagus sp. TR-M5]UZD22493.1 gliding motility lipoprotein GldH [Algoriphagus sp. TR-M5]
MSKRLLLGVALLVGITSCTDERIYEDFQTIPSQNWGTQDSLTFDLGETKLTNSPNLIAVKYNEDYAFTNCYLRIISRDSSQVILENKLVNLILFDPKSGEPLGEGFGSVYTRYDTLPFQLNPATKTVTLLQYMRQDKLPGVEAVGLKIIK